MKACQCLVVLLNTSVHYYELWEEKIKTTAWCGHWLISFIQLVLQINTVQNSSMKASIWNFFVLYLFI